jgi:hypothetical protein
MGIYLGNLGGRDTMINKVKALLLIKEKGFTPCISEEWQATANKLHEAQNASKELQEYIRLMTDQLIALSEHKNACGNNFYFQQIQRKGPINYQDIPELKEVDLEEYRKSDVSYWKLERY